MTTITIKDLSAQVDIARIETDARVVWERQSMRRMRLEQSVVRLLPLAVIVMALAFYLLSAPHTAHILDLITPGWGWVAPIGFELGVIGVAAFREAGYRTWLTILLLGVLLSMATLVNVIGGFMMVIERSAAADVSRLNFEALLSQFGVLPAAYQAALFIVIPIGVTIPLAGWLTGEILIKLAMGKIVLQREDTEKRWMRESSSVMRKALLQAALALGAGVTTAGKWSDSVAGQLYADEGQSLLVPDSPRVLSVPQVPAHVASVVPQKDASDIEDTGQSVPDLDKAAVLLWLRAQPNGIMLMTAEDICRRYTLDIFAVADVRGYKTVQRARKELLLERAQP